MTQNQADTIIIRMKSMPFPSTEYTNAWDAILPVYEKMIYAHCHGHCNHQDINDYYNDVVAAMPSIIDRWRPETSSFSTYFYFNIRSVIQKSNEKNHIIPYGYRQNKYNEQFGLDRPPVKMIYAHQGRNAEHMSFWERCSSQYVNGQTTATQDDMTAYNSIISFVKKNKYYDIWHDIYISELPAYVVGKKYHITSHRIKMIINPINVEIKNRFYPYLRLRDKKDKEQHNILMKKKMAEIAQRKNKKNEIKKNVNADWDNGMSVREIAVKYKTFSSNVENWIGIPHRIDQRKNENKMEE